MTDPSPQVSVVIPAFNQAQYLKQAIDSVLSQTFHDLEIIVVDDGSTDDTAYIAKSFGEAIRYIWQVNQGLAGARNSGILAARGTFIALLDSDDCWLPDFLAKMLALAKSQPGATIFYCGFYYMDHQGQLLSNSVYGKLISPELMYHTLLRINPLLPSGVVMRRDDIIEAGLFDIAFRILEDWELWIRLLKAGHRFRGLAEGLVHYRIHDNSLTTNTAKGQRAMMALASKHFGDDDGNFANWSPEKRLIYGGVYRYHAITTSLVREHDWGACAHYLGLAFQSDPLLMRELDIYYELALGTQPQGLRGSEHHIELTQNASQIESLLELIFNVESGNELAPHKAACFGTAYYALALVAYNISRFDLCRKYGLIAIRYRPALGFDGRLLNTLLKSFVGSSGRQKLHRLRQLFIYL